jgi:hypothetical protein
MRGYDSVVRIGRRVGVVVAVCALTLTVLAGGARAIPPNLPVYDNGGFLQPCQFAPRGYVWACYVNRLLAMINASHDPADELPRIDKRVRAAGGYIEGNCHMIMHVVGRRYGREHHVTLLTLQRYLPKSNDPGCSAGFGMGLVMYLAPQIYDLNPNAVVHMCMRQPTRFRSYTCIHSLGHAYMRMVHDKLKVGVRLCAALPDGQAPDCAQGAFHDYWLSLSGTDGTHRQLGASRSARVVCKHERSSFVRPCWYRYFLEVPPKVPPAHAQGLRRLCRGLGGRQRSGCIGAASLIVSAVPSIQMQVCAQLSATDTVSCLRGVQVQNLMGQPKKQLALVKMCSHMKARAQSGCYRWLGKTLEVVTNGSFRQQGCAQLASRSGRADCVAGALDWNQALGTFS